MWAGSLTSVKRKKKALLGEGGGKATSGGAAQFVEGGSKGAPGRAWEVTPDLHGGALVL